MTVSRSPFGLRRCGLLFALWIAVLVSPAGAQPLTVFAASSLKTALDDIAISFAEQTGQEVRVSYAGSSALARQIAQGAPADVFITAHSEWMRVLQSEGRVVPGSEVGLLSNRLVLIGHGTHQAASLGDGFDLAARLGGGRLAIGLVDAVPAGVYGKAALVALGLWPSVESRLVQTDNVRSALVLVARGEAPLGIVYQTDAQAADGISVVGTFPETSHPRIVYAAAVIAGGNEQSAQAFLSHLQEPVSDAVFRSQGFIVSVE